jgi:hypothetical protein
MAVILEEAVEQLRARVDAGEARLAIQAPSGFGKTALLNGLGEACREYRRVVRVSFPEGDDAALAALVDVAVGLGIVKEIVPDDGAARLSWTTRLDLARQALARAGDDLLLLIDEPRFDATHGPQDDLFAQRAAALTDMLLGVRGGTVVLAGASIPIGVATSAALALPILVCDAATEAAWRLGAPVSPPVVRQFLSALGAAGIDTTGIPRRDLRLDRLVAHDLSSVFLESVEMRRIIARLAAIRVPFSNGLLDEVGLVALSVREKKIIHHLLATVEDGRTSIVPEALTRTIGAHIASGNPAWAPDEPLEDAHLFAARYHRARFEAAKARADVGAAVREELEEIHQLTEAGDAPALITRSLQFVEQYDALGKSLSQRALGAPRDQEESLRRDAVRAYERAAEHDRRDAYAHHYIAYNLDILGIEPERVEQEYVVARDIAPGHPWYHARYIAFLVTTAWTKEAREAWDRALGDLTGSVGSLPPSTYEELHAQVARVLLSRSEVDFAAEVLDDVPDELRVQPWWGALHQLQVCLEEDRDEQLVFPCISPRS